MIQFGTNDVIDYVYPDDPALDRERPDFSWERFEKTRDRKHIPLKDGAEAMVFKVRRLTRKQFFRVMGRASSADQVQEAVAYGLVAVEPACGLSRAQGDIGEKLDDTSLDRVYDLGPNLMISVGTFVLGLSQVKTDPT